MRTLFAIASALALATSASYGAPNLLRAEVEREHAAPGPPPRIVRPRQRQDDQTVVRIRDGEQQYSIGGPTDEEQLSVEFINRARADAAAEAQRLKDTDDPNVLSSYEYYRQHYGLDLDQMVIQFADLPQTLPPLSINAKLTTAARLHSQDMFNNAFQGHYSSANPVLPNEPGDSLGSRVDRQSYDYSTVAENVYSYADSVWHAHAGFDVDWGNGPYGMQSPPGHRTNIHSADMREIGVGVVLGTNTIGGNTVGPLVVTQDLGTQQGDSPFVTGVAYFDLDGNGFYDLGEGIGGVRVDVTGSGYFAETAASGGYSVPVPGDGSYQVTFSGLGFAESAHQVTVSEGGNVKCDFTATYSAPTISGDTTPPMGVATTYSLTESPGATTYTLRQGTLSEADWTEGAENGSAGMTIDSTTGYDVITSQSKSAGSYGFHLAHPESVRQAVTFDAVFIPTAASELQFAKRLGWASAGQQAHVDLLTDPIRPWVTVWSQSGTGDAGEGSFSTATVSLAEFAGSTVQMRFAYEHYEGSYYYQTDGDVGFSFDEITITNASWCAETTTTDLGDVAEFAFTPAAEGSYFLQVRGGQTGRGYSFGSPLTVQASVQGPFELDLGPGWNMVSIPRQLPQGQDAVTAVFPDVVFPSAWKWHNSLYSLTNTLVPLAGHWILRDATETTVQLDGEQLIGTPVDLVAGWNLVGVPAKTAKPTAPEVGGEIWFWSPVAVSYQAVPDTGPDAFLFPGLAYWVDATAPFRLYP